MILKVLTGITLVVFMAGCSTTKTAMPSSSHMQLRVSSIESQLDDQSQDISELKTSVSELSNSVKHVVSLKQHSGTATKTIKKVVSNKQTQSKYQNILRVPVAPREVQSALKEAGYYQGTIDGRLGPQSERAIKEFQSDHDLASDGIVGKKTWTELKTYLE